jgi:dUTP pyrophosphatase
MSSSPVGLRVARIHARAALPHYASSGAAGLDLTAAIDAPVVLAPLERAKLPTGLVLGLPPGHEGQVRPRSGLAIKQGLTVLNAPGTIDEDYRGELAVLLVNLSHEPVTISPGDRIAQLVIAPVTRANVVEVESVEQLGATERGAGGFGSTGGRAGA